MQKFDQWVCWKAEWNEKRNKYDKIPYNPLTGYRAKADVPSSWSCFNDTSKAYQLSNGKYTGIGIELSKNDPLCGVDLDGCIDDLGIIAPWAWIIIKLLNSYTEISPSGKGLRIFVIAELNASGRRNRNIEVYTDGRFLTVTGHHIEGTPLTVEARQSEIDQFHKKYIAKPVVDQQRSEPAAAAQSLGDIEILAKARKAKNGNLFGLLFDRGDWQAAGYQSQSEADLALANILSFWCGCDSGRMENLLRQSALYHKKYDERHYSSGETYLEHVVKKAVNDTVDVYQPRGKIVDFPAIQNQQSLSDYFVKTTTGFKIINPRLGEHIISKERFVNSGETLYIYQNGVYVPKGAEVVRKTCKDLTGDYYKKDLVNEVAYYIETVCRKEPEKLNNRPELVNVKNGLLDWKTGKLYKHDPNYLSTIQLPVVYDPRLTSPATDKFWSEIVPNDCLPVLEEMFGYSMIPETKYQKSFMLTGGGSNGKGTLLDQLTAFIGRANTSNVPLQDLSEHRFKRAEIFGKLINLFADLDAKALLSTSYFKMVVAGDEIDAERKHRDPFFFRPFAKLIFSANELPRSNDRTFAYYRRWIIISFPNRFVIGKNANNNLIKTITTEREMSGVLNRALNGLRRLDKQGAFTESQTIIDELEKYKIKNDSVAAFLNDCCNVGLKDDGQRPFVSKSHLYDAYKTYIMENNLKQLSRQRFHERLLELRPEIYEDRPGAGTRFWIGVGLNEKSFF